MISAKKARENCDKYKDPIEKTMVQKIAHTEKMWKDIEEASKIGEHTISIFHLTDSEKIQLENQGFSIQRDFQTDNIHYAFWQGYIISW